MKHGSIQVIQEAKGGQATLETMFIPTRWGGIMIIFHAGIARGFVCNTLLLQERYDLSTKNNMEQHLINGSRSSSFLIFLLIVLLLWTALPFTMCKFMECLRTLTESKIQVTGFGLFTTGSRQNIHWARGSLAELITPISPWLHCILLMKWQKLWSWSDTIATLPWSLHPNWNNMELFERIYCW